MQFTPVMNDLASTNSHYPSHDLVQLQRAPALVSLTLPQRSWMVVSRSTSTRSWPGRSPPHQNTMKQTQQQAWYAARADRYGVPVAVSGSGGNVSVVFLNFCSRLARHERALPLILIMNCLNLFIADCNSISVVKKRGKLRRKNSYRCECRRLVYQRIYTCQETVTGSETIAHQRYQP